MRYEYRQGKGNVIRSMFRDIEADCYLMIDGDDTYPAENARDMCDLVLQGKADMVIGDRLSSTYFEENKRPFHNVGNVLVRKFINLFWRPKQPIVDVMTGYRAFSPMFVKTFPILSQYRDRPVGSESKLNTYTDGIKVLLTIFNLYRDYKPLRFFGIGAIILAVVSLTLFTPVFISYLKTGIVFRVPTLVVSVVMMLAAFLSVVCGLILDTNAKNSRKNLEVQMNIIRMLLKK